MIGILLSRSEGYCQLFHFIDCQTVVISLHQSFCSWWKKKCLVNDKNPHFDTLLFGVVTINGRAGRAQSSDCVPSIFGGCIRLFDTDCEMYLIVRYEWFTEFPGHVVKEILIEEKEIEEDQKTNRTLGPNKVIV